MSWQDTAAALAAPNPSAPPLPRLAPVTTPVRYSSLDAPSVGERAFSNTHPGRALPGFPTPSYQQPYTIAPSAPKEAPVEAPEAFRLSMPFSTNEPGVSPVGPLQPASYRAQPNENVAQGVLDALGQSAADALRPDTGGVNVANFPAVLYQANGSILHAFNQALPNPATGFVESGFNAAMDIVNGVSNILAPIMEAPERILRDASLTDRAKKYAALITGAISPMQLAGSASVTPLYPGQAGDPIEGLRILVASVTGTTEQQQRKITAATFDLPDNVKAAIEADPRIALDDGKLAKLFDDSGRQWTYQGGLAGIAENAAPGLAILAAEVLGTGGIAGAVKALGLSSKAPIVASATRLATTTFSWGLKANKVALAAGATQFGATAILNATARIVGNQTALDFANDAFAYHPISMNPNVQLVTSFTVNPFAALGAAKRGIVRLGNGAVVKVGALTGKGIADSWDQLDRIVGHIYGIERPSVGPAIDKYFTSRGEAIDHVVNLAAQDVLDRLPLVEKAGLRTYVDPIQRTDAVLRLYGPQIVDTLENHLDRLRTNVQTEYTAYRGFLAPFDPYRALQLGMDYRAFKTLTYGIRSELDAVAAYPGVLLPEASRGIRTALADSGERVPTSLVDDLNARYSALAKYVRPLAPKVNGNSLAKDDLLDAIDLADRDYARLASVNPVLTRSGIEPILRPDATPREWADSFGTTPDVIAAVLGKADPVAQVDTLRPFLIAKKEALGLSEERIAAMPPEEVWATANTHLSDTAEPWLAMGQRVKSAESMARVYRARAAEEIAAGNRDEADRLLKQVAQQEELIRGASGPLTPFTTTLRNAVESAGLSDAGMRDLAARKVDAIRRLDEADAILDQVQTLVSPTSAAYRDPAAALGALAKNREGQWVSLSGPGVPAGLQNRLKTFLLYTPDHHVSVTEADNGTLWRLIRQYAGSTNAKGVRFRLTQSQSTALKNAIGRIGDPLEDFAPHGTLADTLKDQLIPLRERYDALFGKQARFRSEQDASRLVPQRYLDAVQNDRRWMTHDYVYETQHLRTITGDVSAALDHPNDPAIYGTIPDLVHDNELLGNDLAEAARRRNIPLETFLTDPQYADDIRAALPDLTSTPTPLDEALIAAVATGDHAKLDAALDEVHLTTALGRPKPPFRGVTLRQAEAAADGRQIPHPDDAARPPKAPESLPTSYDRRLRAAQADYSALPDREILAKPENAVGREVLSLIGWGVPGREPSTIDDVLTILREITDGNAEHAGFGPDVLSQAQGLAQWLLDRAIHQTDRASFEAGIFIKGTHPSQLNPDTLEFARKLLDDGRVAYDPTNAFGLQYGFAKAPKAAVTTEIEELRRLADETGIPSLAEELFSGHFQPFQERIGSTRVGQGFRWLHGTNANADITARARAEFVTRAARIGVDPKDANRVWDGWSDFARESNLPKKVTSESGRLSTIRSEHAIFTSPTNTPNAKLLEIAGRTIRDANGGSLRGYDTVPWDQLFRESYSGPMRLLADSPIPFGRKLELVYGLMTNNDWVRWRYGQLRFAMDARWHAMNAMEGLFLYGGRSALRPATTDAALLGATHDWLARTGEDAITNTGYALSRSRMHWAERAFLKEQPDALRNALVDLETRDPELIRQAFVEEAGTDPELAKTIAAMGDTPESYVAAMDTWYRRVLGSTDPGEAAMADIADAMANEPAMQEVYGRLTQVNRELWDDVKTTFFGNPNRSRVERALNHWALFWPLSYQLRSTKWLLKVMYDRVGGIPTNSLGAYQLDKIVGMHNHMLATDPAYQRWIKNNPALLFAAQMLMPITPNSLGVSLNPLMRDLFFNRSKNFLAIGPVYTATQFLPNTVGDLYQSLGDVPIMHDLLGPANRGLGRKPPKPDETAPGIDDSLPSRSQ